ncbi:phosphodiester glycosidase family protein [Roseofilum casamattae]|uniref:Phosphodiester glycosidase family protein n=1 Tax=Roseofilum casamattae BLCC-M143 TaxID=3022442 RepID=A0ABT7BXP3_9CYAN|nr:phosphodiester glycosidase family protein [Roseofilum casamattae]MDJ1183304.1 phosphodiester glycosidase family protein [Roseofilum casamattae BLCC-M143]
MLSLLVVALLGSEIVSNSNPLPIDGSKSCADGVARVCREPASTRLSQTLSQQRNQIVINGKRLSVPWTQWQENGRVRIGISDMGLSSSLGVELLSTSNPKQQAIQWYAPLGQTQAILTARLGESDRRSAPQFRYVDVTDWIGQLGWQMVPQGNTLMVQTSPSRVLGIRQGTQAWGERLVVNVDRSTPVRLNHAPGKAIVSVDATIAPQLLEEFESKPGNAISSVKVSPQSGRTEIEIMLKSKGVRPQIVTLNAPYRVAIDLRLDGHIPTKQIQWSPGIQWRQQMVNLGSSQFPVVWLEVDPKHPDLHLRPIGGQSQPGMQGTLPLVKLAPQVGAAAGINAGFFNRNNRLPLGAILRDGVWLSGPILNRGAIAWNDRGEFLIDRLSLTETLIAATGERSPILYLNSGYVKAGLSRYTPAWGQTYTTLTNNETIVSVSGDRIIGQTDIPSARSEGVPIPPQGYLLVYRGDTPRPFFLPGTSVQVQRSSFPALENRYPFALGAGPLLVKQGRVVLNAEAEGFSPAFIRQKASRSAIGLNPQGRLIIAAVHDRAYGKGPSLSEIAQIMQRLGAVEALNLDGGSSTGLYLGGQLRDRSPRSAARIHNGLGIFLKPQP